MEENRTDDHIFLTFRKSAEYLEVHPQTLENMIRADAIKPDITLNRLRYFRKATLNAWLSTGALSFDEIAHRYGLTKRTVHHHFRVKRFVEPDLVRSGRMLYYEETVKELADRIGWTLSDDVGGTDIESTAAHTSDDLLCTV